MLLQRNLLVGRLWSNIVLTHLDMGSTNSQIAAPHIKPLIPQVRDIPPTQQRPISFSSPTLNQFLQLRPYLLSNSTIIFTDSFSILARYTCNSTSHRLPKYPFFSSEEFSKGRAVIEAARKSIVVLRFLRSCCRNGLFQLPEDTLFGIGSILPSALRRRHHR